MVATSEIVILVASVNHHLYCCLLVTAVRLSQKVPRGVQAFAHVVSHVSQMGSAVCTFTKCACWRVCTMAGHARTCDTSTRFRFSGVK